MDAGLIFTQHGAALERVAGRIVGDREEARDIVADAFAALLAAGPSDPCHAVPWLYVAVRHRAYNRVRRQTMARRRLPFLAVETEARESPESVLRDDPKIRVLVSSATARLNERDRMAVSMRHVDEAPYEEIAAALGTTVIQARVVVHRANIKLRRNVMASLSRRHAASCDRSDELATLLHTPVVASAGRLPRVRDAIRGRLCRAQARTAHMSMQVGELLTSSIALVAVVAGCTAMPGRVAEPPPTPAPALPVPSGAVVERTGRVPEPSPVSAPSDAVSFVAVPTGGEPLLGSPVRFHDPGIAGTSDPEQSIWTVLGVPRVLYDALEVSADPSNDIRSIEFATLADHNGRPQALRWRIELAAPPDPAGSDIELVWGYEGTDCTTVFEWPLRPDLALLTRCPVAPAPVNRLSPLRLEMASADSPVQLRLDGMAVETTLPFRSLDDRTRAFLYPGAWLQQIFAHSCPGGECADYDRAPDEGGYTYQVER